MHRRMIKLLAALWALGAAATWGSASASVTERILNYDVSARIMEDASLKIREDLTVMVTNDRIKRGIVRAFPVEYRDAQGRTVTVGFNVLSTVVDGVPLKWNLSREGRAALVRMGSPDVTLKPGVHRFVLEYVTTKQIGFFEDHDELYWNVTGNRWKFPILKASFSLSLPGSPPGRGFSAVQWYTGPAGSRSRDGAVRNGDGSVSSTTPLAPGEGLTVVYAWPKGIVNKPLPGMRERIKETLFDAAEPLARGVLWIGTASALLCALAALRRAIENRRGKKTVMPLFHPPAGMTPASARYMNRLKADNGCFSAEIINLAVSGEIKILRPSKHSFSLQWLNQRKKGTLDPMDVAISKALFPDGKSAGTVLPVTDDSRHLFASARDIMKHRLEKTGKSLFSVNSRLVYGIYASLFLSGLLVSLLDEGIGGVAPATAEAASTTCVLSVFCFFWELLRAPGKSRKSITRAVFLGFTMALWISSASSLRADGRFTPLECISAALYVSGILLSPFMCTLSDAGKEAVAAVEGLKMYIGAAEKNRLEFFNPPDDTPQVFERLLPYAVALDCVNTWAARFENVLNQAGYSPDWCQDCQLDQGGIAALSAAQTASSLNSFASNFSDSLGAAMTPPGSSSGLSDDSESGGGCSGGGGGGGGGDGW